jgi:hypothetical protein
MTVTDAHAVNLVLQYLLGIPSRYGQGVSAADVRVATRTLIDHAHKRLRAGVMPDEVEDAWEAMPIELAQTLYRRANEPRRVNGAPTKKPGSSKRPGSRPTDNLSPQSTTPRRRGNKPL